MLFIAALLQLTTVCVFCVLFKEHLPVKPSFNFECKIDMG